MAVLRFITSSNLTGVWTGSSLGFAPFEDAIDIGRGCPKIIDQVRAVGQQAADFNEETERIDGRETVASRQRCDLYAIGDREGVRDHDQSAIRFASLCSNDGIELGPVVNRCYNRPHCDRRCGGFKGVQVRFGVRRRCRVEQERDPIDARRANCC